MVTTEDQGHFILSYSRLWTDKWYLFGSGVTERDEFEDLNHLISFDAGPGYQFWKSDEKNLSIGLGVGYVNEKYSVAQESLGGRESREYAAAVWLVEVIRGKEISSSSSYSYSSSERSDSVLPMTIGQG